MYYKVFKGLHTLDTFTPHNIMMHHKKQNNTRVKTLVDLFSTDASYYNSGNKVVKHLLA